MRVLITGASGFVGSEILVLLARTSGCGPVAALRRPLAVPGAATVIVGDLGPQTDGRLHSTGSMRWCTAPVARISSTTARLVF